MKKEHRMQKNENGAGKIDAKEQEVENLKEQGALGGIFERRKEHRPP